MSSQVTYHITDIPLNIGPYNNISCSLPQALYETLVNFTSNVIDLLDDSFLEKIIVQYNNSNIIFRTDHNI